MSNKRWAVMLQPIEVEDGEVAMKTFGEENICILETLPCPEEEAEDVYVEGDINYWKSHQVGDIVVLEDTGKLYKLSPLFREIVNG